MSFRNEIERGLEQIQQLQELYRQVRDMEMLPLSFFSSSYDILRSLTASLHEMETTQLNRMQEQLSKHQNIIVENKLMEETPSYPKEEQDTRGDVRFLADTISKRMFEGTGLGDLKKVISLNDRFLFQRELFGGDAKKLDDTLNQLKTCSSLSDAMNFLNENFNWNWEDEPAILFREILEKRFL